MEGYSEKGLVRATEQGHLYDYIAEHYTEMSTYSLKEVLLSVLGVGYDECRRHGVSEEVYAELITSELAERGFGED